MKSAATLAAVVMAGTLAAMPLVANTSQDPVQQDLTDGPITGTVINFGHPQTLLGIGNHVLDPDEVTILKGGTVTFRTNGLGHGIAIYPVSKNTTRQDIAEDLCQGGPTVCNATTGTARVYREITDGDGRVVVVIQEGGPANPIDYEPGEVVSVGRGAFLTGTRPDPDPTKPPLPGTLVRARFEEDGRYLVMCINRAHAVNEWMFGFVNVTTPR